MEDFKSLFRHDEALRIIICRACEHAIEPKSAARHLNEVKNHKGISLEERRRVIRYISELDLVQEAKDLKIPLGQQKIHGLEIVKNCCRCQHSSGCRELRRDLKQMHSHCHRAHPEWMSAKGRGGSRKHRESKDTNAIWSEGHLCQVLFKKDPWPRLIEVKEDERRLPILESPARRAKLKEMGRAILRSIDEEEIEAEKGERVRREDLLRSEVSTWILSTRWDVHLEGFLIKQLKECVAEKVEEEEKHESAALKIACRCLQRLLKKALMRAHPDYVDRQVLTYVNRKEADAEVKRGTKAGNIFHNNLQADTVKKYISTWCKVLRYLWRSQSWEERPDYELTDEQQDHLDRVQRQARGDWTDLGERERERQEQLMEEELGVFFLSMFDHEYEHEFKSGLVSAFAVLGLDQDFKGWVPPIHYTPKMAGLTTMLRALVVYMSARRVELEVELAMADGMSEREAQKTVTRGVADLVMEASDKMLFRQRLGQKARPIDRVHDLMSYAQAIVSTTNAPAKVSWTKSLDTVMIDNVSFTMGALRDFIRDMLDRCRDKLVEELCFTDVYGMPKIDISELQDTASNATGDYSFMSNAHNAEMLQRLPVGEDAHPECDMWLWNRMYEERGMYAKFFEKEDGEDGKLPFSRHGVLSYLREVKCFKEELLVLCHMSAGAPARIPELLSVQWKNSSDGLVLRGVFVDDGLVVLVTSYHKGHSKTKSVKVIHRYLPDEVGKLVIWYLNWVRPFVSKLARYDGKVINTSHLWQPMREKKVLIYQDDEEENVVEDEEESDSDDDAVREAEESEEEEESTVSREVDKRRRDVKREPDVDGLWRTERVRNVMSARTERMMAAKIGPKTWRQLYPAIQRTQCQDPEMTAVLGELYDGKQPENVLLQSGHGSKMASSNYGRLLTQHRQSATRDQYRFKVVSKRWHQFLRFPSSRQYEFVTGLDGWKDTVAEKSWQMTMQRHARIAAHDIHEVLKGMVGARAEFRGKQEEAIKAVMARDPRVLVVMGTGAGKSLLYMLPAACSVAGTTIVVLPLVSLVDDQYRRCKDLGLRVKKWDSNDRRKPRHAQLVLVTPESAVALTFHNFINEMVAEGLLDRIVIDECHVVLDSNAGWRKDMFKLRDMLSKETQVLYLTATMPVQDVDVFEDLMGLRRQELTRIRQETSRPNLSYRVQEFRGKDEHEHVQDVVDMYLSKYETGKIVIYCDTLVELTSLGQKLNAKMYHRESGDRREKNDVLRELVGGESRVFVATNALGLGIDAPQIRVVIHTSPRRLLRDFAQESGRAGRDGGLSESLVMRMWRRSKHDETKWFRPSIPKGTEPDMIEYLAGKACRRRVLGRAMDGDQSRVTCEGGEQWCDVCERFGNRRRRVIVATSTSQRERLDREYEEADAAYEQYVHEQSYTQRNEERQSVRAREEEEEEEDDDDDVEVDEDEEEFVDSALADVFCESVVASSSLVVHKRGASKELVDHEAERKRVAIFRESEYRLGEDARLYAQIDMEENAIDEDLLRRKVERWRTRACVLCWVAEDAETKANAPHSPWERCDEHNGTEARENMIALWRELNPSGRVRFEPFACCNKCGLPQSMCNDYEEDMSGEAGRTRKFKKVVGGRCSNYALIRRLYCAYVAKKMANQDMDSEDWMWVRDRMGAVNGFLRDARSKTETDVARLHRWISKRHVSRGLETSNAVLMLYHFDERGWL